MSETYVRILLRGDTPIPLVADFVRESSLLYPRPVPLALFAGVLSPRFENEVYFLLPPFEVPGARQLKLPLPRETEGSL